LLANTLDPRAQAAFQLYQSRIATMVGEEKKDAGLVLQMPAAF
jgi:hypothetical protein